MSDHDARSEPREEVRTDAGAWISGPSLNTEPVAAAHVIAGDKLFYDGTVVTVTDNRASRFWLGLDLCDGLAIDWEAGNRLGRMFRRASDVLDRLA
jgi:hypothetical protein